MDSMNHNVLRVYRTKAQAKRNYDKISRIYDYFAGGFESNYRNMGLEQLNIVSGETVLEIGFGTGHCLMQIAKSVGSFGIIANLSHILSVHRADHINLSPGLVSGSIV